LVICWKVLYSKAMGKVKCGELFEGFAAALTFDGTCGVGLHFTRLRNAREIEPLDQMTQPQGKLQKSAYLIGKYVVHQIYPDLHYPLLYNSRNQASRLQARRRSSTATRTDRNKLFNKR